MHLNLKRTPGLYLAGFMGCGKTTVGPLLANELGWRFVDIDAEVEKERGKSISQIFSEEGEPAFRELESRMIRRCVRAIEAGEASVVSLGGGAFVSESNWELVQRNGITLWLDCPLERLRQRIASSDARPLARDPEGFKRLYEARRKLYARAHFCIDADVDDPSQVVQRILQLPIF